MERVDAAGGPVECLLDDLLDVRVDPRLGDGGACLTNELVLLCLGEGPPVRLLGCKLQHCLVEGRWLHGLEWDRH